MRYSVFPTILMFFMLVGSVWASDPSTPKANLCLKGSKACRMLAVQVAKLNFSDLIKRKMDSRPRSSFLCPEDNPQCCPPNLMPLCSQTEKDYVFETRREVLAGWDSFLCEVNGGNWSELTGTCKSKNIADRVFDPPFPPWQDDCDPCREKHNSKGYCIKKKSCPFRGIMLSCDFVCRKAPDAVKVKTVKAKSSNLIRHLSDKDVQLEAAKQVHEDLKTALEFLDAEIKILSKQNHKK
jgi:hypothetical protein